LILSESYLNLSTLQEDRENGIAAKNLPIWGNWQWDKNFLPKEFHSTAFLTQMKQLAKEKWLIMSKDQAILVVLSIGLALREIHTVHFLDPDGDARDDLPQWILKSPHSLTHSNKLLHTWKRQLAVVHETSESECDSKSKGKSKVKSMSGKRRAKSPTPEDDNDDMRSRYVICHIFR
jgi:hypothetical protein